MGKKNKMKKKTIDMVSAKLRENAAMLYCISQDSAESNWKRDEAYTLYRGYKDAADFVSTLKDKK